MGICFRSIISWTHQSILMRPMNVSREGLGAVFVY